MIPKKTVFLFVAFAVGVFCVLVFSSSWQQGWFAKHEEYSIEFPSGDGLNEGTAVSMSGLKAGRVVSVDLGDHNKVMVRIRIQKKYAERLRADSKAIVGRPFIIGEKAISLVPGSSDQARVKPGTLLIGEESLEITDLLSGGRLSPYMQTLSKLMDQLRIVIEGDGSQNSANLVEVYKQAYKSLKSIDSLAREVTTIRRDFVVSPEMHQLVKGVATSTGDLQQVLAQMNTAMPAVTSLSGDVAKMMPQLTKTLNETVFTLQALQKSFILRGAVADLKEERAREDQRRPASVPETTVDSVSKPNSL